MEEILRFKSASGVSHVIESDERGNLYDRATQPVGDILDRNKAMLGHNDGYTPSREMRRVASIPLSLVLKWKMEEGWDAFDPAHSDKLRQKLNDPDFLYLRTSEGRLGATQDGGFR